LIVAELAELIAEMRAKTATLTIACGVAGARVLVRGKQVGVTPMETPLQVPAGKAKIEVIAEGYLPFAKEFDLQGGVATKIDAPLVTKATSGVLRIEANVDGAFVVVDGTPQGQAPIEIVVGAGAHSVVVRHAGYEEKQTQTVVDAGASRTLTVTLEKDAPITAKWWFWTGVGVVVIGGGLITYALLTEKKPGSGDHFQPNQVSGPMIKW
jgi:hypothetical protein